MEEEFTIQDIAEKAGEIQGNHLDLFALAFMQETGLKPSECELVQQITLTGIRWFFKKK